MKREMPFLKVLTPKLKAHWGQIFQWGVTQPTPVEMKMPGGITLNQFSVWCDNLDTEQGYVVDLRDTAAGDSGLVMAQKTKIRNKIRQFRDAVPDIAPGSDYVRRLPDLPDLQDGAQTYSEAAMRVLSLWLKINTDNGLPDFTPPLNLKGGYNRDSFQTDVTLLGTRYQTLEDDLTFLSGTRDRRDTQRKLIDKAIDAYPRRVRNFLPDGHELLSNIPRISPLPSVTIPQLKASGKWKAALGHAEVSWTGEIHPDCDRIEVHLSLPNAPWDAESAQLVATAAPTATSIALPDDAIAPGDYAYAKAIVFLTSGNQRGSKPFKIVCPAAP